MNYFARNLKFLRENKKLDQQKVADDLKVPRATYACWETAKRTPKIEQILEIANYFNVDMDIISRDYSIQQNNNISPLDELLYSKAKDLSNEDKVVIMNVIDSIKKKIDEEKEV